LFDGFIALSQGFTPSEALTFKRPLPKLCPAKQACEQEASLAKRLAFMGK